MFSSTHGCITIFSFHDDRDPEIEAKNYETKRIAGKKYPVKIRICHKRERKYYPTGKKISIDEWEELPKTKKSELVKVRNEIQTSFKIVDDVVRELFNADCFSFEALNIRLGRGTGQTLNTAFKAKINILESEGRVGSHLYYRVALKSITGFSGNDIKFSDVTPDWLGRYEKHLLKDGKKYTTIGMYTRAIRTIINEAKRNGQIKESQYPFGKNRYEIPTGEGRKLALNMQQIKSIVSYSDGTEATERFRDLWFFSYLCNGINFADLLKLKYSNIDGDEICFYRQKTIRTSKVKKEIRAVVTAEMRAMIDRWGNPDRSTGNFIFPYFKGGESPMREKAIILDITKRTNKRLKVIGAALGIEGLSTYSARHSFASVLKRSGANIAFISESLGHSDLKTTETYLASFEKDERRKNAELLTRFD